MPLSEEDLCKNEKEIFASLQQFVNQQHEERIQIFKESLEDTDIPKDLYPIIRQLMRTAYVIGDRHAGDRHDFVRNIITHT